MRRSSTALTADVYRTAAREHLTIATELFETERYGAACYLAGVAVECMLRAYRYRFDPRFESRHDLRQLAEEGRFFSAVPEQRRDEVNAALGDLTTRWANSHRYRSDSALRTFFHATDNDVLPNGRRVRGDAVKYNACILIDAAAVLVTEGESRWTSSSRR